MRTHRAPRLIGTSAAVLGAVVLIALVAFAGGAAAVVGPTDLVLTKSDSPDPVAAGSNLTYTITVRNAGTNDASAVTVADQLPGGVDFVSAAGCTKAGNNVTCNLGQLNAGQSTQVTIIVRPKKDGQIVNTASVTSPEDPATGGNNADTETTQVTKKAAAKKKGKISCATPTQTGTAGDDVITGTNGGDVIVTFGGNDQVFALGGKDLVCTGLGFDFVAGGLGGDTIIGGGNADRLKGNGGGDLLKGKNGRDRLRGQSGNDVLNGGKKRDSCKGGAGRDTLVKCP